MQIRCNDTRVVNAPAAALFEVLTDYPTYPRFNPAVLDLRVVRKDGGGAEFVARRRTGITRRLRAYDRYELRRELVVERTYEGSPSARSAWTIDPAGHDRCTLTIDASRDLPLGIGLALRPFLRRSFRRVDVLPFVREAERRAREASTR